MLARHPLLFILLWSFSLAAAFILGRNIRPQLVLEPEAVLVPPVAEALPLRPTRPAGLLTPPESEAVRDETAALSDAPGQIKIRPAPWMTRTDHAKLFREALDNDHPLERLNALNEVVQHLDPDNIMDVLQVFADKPPSWDRMRELNYVLYAWAQFDAPAAMDFSRLHVRDPRMRMQSSQQVMTSWASVDPDTALEWAREDFKGKDNPHLVGIIDAVSKTDLSRASDLLLELPYGAHRGRAASILVGEYLDQHSVEQTMHWASGVPDERLKDGLIRMTAYETANKAPRKTVEWVLANASADGLKSALTPALQSWGRTEPEAALSWSLDLDDPGLRSAGVAGAMNQWARRDADAAGAWLKETGPSKDRDTAIKAYSASILRRDPEGALAWATDISDQGERHRTLERIASHLIEHNPDKAREMGLMEKQP